MAPLQQFKPLQTNPYCKSYEILGACQSVLGSISLDHPSRTLPNQFIVSVGCVSYSESATRALKELLHGNFVFITTCRVSH